MKTVAEVFAALAIAGIVAAGLYLSLSNRAEQRVDREIAEYWCVRAAQRTGHDPTDCLGMDSSSSSAPRWFATAFTEEP